MNPTSRLTDLNLPADTTDPAWRDDLSARRLDLAALQAQAEDLGLSRRAEAIGRLALMIDVWECLVEDSPRKALEISRFCAEGFEALTDPETRSSDDASAWILRESLARWGDYLRLIDPESLEAAESAMTAPAAGSEPDRDDTPSALGTEALLRMLTGQASPPADEPVEPPPLNLPFEIPPAPRSLAIDPELRETFLAEATDLFDRIETQVLGLSQSAHRAETLHEIGRCFHTLKGAAGSVGLLQLAALVHGMEEQLESDDGHATDAMVALLHRFLHYLEGIFLALRRGGQSGPEPVSLPPVPPPARSGASVEAIAQIKATEKIAAVVPVDAEASRPLRRKTDRGCRPTPEAEAGEGPVRISAERIDALMDLASELMTRRDLWTAQAETLKDHATLARSSRVRLMATIDRLRDLRPSRPALSIASLGRPGPPDDGDELPELIRRLTEQADDLMVVTEAAQATAKPLADNSEALARLSLQLWESLQAIRIIPVRSLFQRLARVAHDAARVEGRPVEVIMIGEETGVDRAVQDKAFEPLLHVVRNSVCHGIEPADVRLRAGKPASGRITLEASRTGQSLMLSVRDDGRGLNYEAIAAKGRRLGLIGPTENPSVERLNALIFQSGFTTREEANAIAGRGVGMDVVSQEISRLHGSIALTSESGAGTCLSLTLPARLSLQQAMILRVDGQAFALPVELIDLAQPFDPADVDVSGPQPRARIRDQWVPMTSAREALGFAPDSESVSCPKLLLIRADGGPLAVLVDAIAGTCELVLKPLGPMLEGHPLLTGTSLSVNGEVIFALNPAGLARWPREGRQVSAPAGEPQALRSAPILVVDDSISVRKVVARHLRALGHEVEEVSDGLEALGKIRSRHYGLVFSDLEMPRMDGVELLAELYRLEIAPAVPVIIASSRSDPETRRRILGLGAREFLSKPIEPEVLTVMIQRVFPDHAATLAGSH